MYNKVKIYGYDCGQEEKVKKIATIMTDFSEKFGIPRQSGRVPELIGKIIFEPEYRRKEAFRGLEGYSHLWLIWEFSEIESETWHPTVRPPRLGGNKRVGVFATRSPYRPNPIGLSSVKLEKIELSSTDGPVLFVSGADLMSGTPIYDIKPYLPSSDSHPDAVGGFADEKLGYSLDVDFPDELCELIPTEKISALKSVLAEDPRPSYQNDPSRIYGFEFAGFEVKFKVENGLLSVVDVVRIN